jgi:hypothetical protein
MSKQKRELTFKHNLKHGRHGWLRLTPAYSIKLVHDLFEKNPQMTYVLDPFCGTGTTGLVSAQQGIDCDLLEINPFLVWFATVKTTNYAPDDLRQAGHAADQAVSDVVEPDSSDEFWLPPISNIERWWREDRLMFLGRLHHAIHELFPNETHARNLLMVAFCRLMIECSNAAFNHQSMSFKEEPLGLFAQQESDLLTHRFIQLVREIISVAEEPISGRVRVIHADSRQVPRPNFPYDAIITSPPYPNRMSYIRELRPYMYWMGFLKEARQASALDWQAIGGTWGAATSWLQKWSANGARVHFENFDVMIQQIAQRSLLLANYVHKYFVDMSQHIDSVYDALAPNAKIFYVVGNSKFYDTIVPVERIYSAMLRHRGFVDVEVEMLRKRNSKKELLEFVVKGRKP